MGNVLRDVSADRRHSHSEFSSGMAAVLDGARREAFKQTELHFLALGIIGMARDIANYDGYDITEERIRRRFGLFDIKETKVIGKEFLSVTTGYKISLVYDHGDGTEELSVYHESLERGREDIVSVLIRPTYSGPVVFFLNHVKQDGECSATLAVEYYKLTKNESARDDGVGDDITEHSMLGWAKKFMKDWNALSSKDIEANWYDFKKMQSAVVAEKINEMETRFREGQR